MVKTGRPKSDNPKAFKVSSRLNQEEYERLKKYASIRNLTISQLLRQKILEMIDTES